MKKYEDMKHGTRDFPLGIHDTVCENGFSLYPHIHREFEFLVMKKGRGTVYIENEKFEIGEGEGVFINSEELHIGVKTNNEPAEFFAVVFAPEVFGNLYMDAIMQKYVEPVIKNKICIERRVSKRVVELLDKIHQRPGELRIKALLYDIWAECIASAKEEALTQKSKAVDMTKTVMAYIRENYDKGIALEDMARCVNISCGYLCREFKKVMYMTPFEYLMEIRIDKGCELLRNTDLTIGEVAQRCGFNSFSYFTKLFGERLGCSPKEYRQKNIKTDA